MRYVLSGFCLVMITAVATQAQADRRNFAFTYEPKTMAPGEVELEWYMTGNVRRNYLTGKQSYAWGHQVEIEYGVIDGVDVGMYQMFSPTAWQGYKLRGRWMPFAPGELPIDFLFYLEMIHKADGAFSLEERVVVGKTFDFGLIIALDMMTEQGPLNKKKIGFKFNNSLAIGYQVTEWFTAGLETQLRLSWESRKNFATDGLELVMNEPGLYLGPSVSFAVQRIFFDLSVAPAVSAGRDDAQLLFRTLIGIFI